MTRNRLLVQWIGHSDLKALAASLPKSKQKSILDRLRSDLESNDGLGPTKTLLSKQKFDRVILLSNYEPRFNSWFQEWLQTPVELVQVELKQPTDYAAIFKIADEQLNALRQTQDLSDTELCLHLSPGTPAMTAVWLLLGKTRYPATFYETSRKGDCWITDVPFELVDIIPDVLKNPDLYLQHLSSESPSEVAGFEDIIGSSRSIRDAVGRAKRAAVRSISVLLLGESGTGKEMFAKAIHKASPRRDKPFRAINCAALSQTLLESELFGHGRGAFTGADRERKGAFEAADGGVIFLDEVGECALETQAKLLRVLQPLTNEGPAIRSISRLGEDKDRKVNVRIIAATNKDLHKAILSGEFREDLYYRLAGITITLPPLRARRSDIPKIADHLLATINRQFQADEPGYVAKKFSSSANSFVKSHNWPGNIRQLYNALAQAAVFTDGETIGKPELVAALGEMPSASTGILGVADLPLGDDFCLDRHLKEIEKAYIQKALEEAQGVKSKARRLLGLRSDQALAGKMKSLKLQGNSD